MPTTLTALFAAALHEAQATEAGPAGVQRAAALLVTAAGARRIEWQVDTGRLVVNGFPLRRGAPGAPLVVECLEKHLTRSLALPAGLNANQWVELSQLYASAPGIYPTAEHMRVAVASVVAGAKLVTSADRIPETHEVTGAPPGSIEAFSDAVLPGDPALVSPKAGLSALSTKVDPILDAARAAVDRADWLEVARLLVELDQVVPPDDQATRAILARERRRVFPKLAIEHLMVELPTDEQSSVVMAAIDTLGNKGAEAVFELLADQPTRARHKLYLDVLTRMQHAEQAIIQALSSEDDGTARDAAVVVGRRGMAKAVPVLGALLRHANAEVRTAAWRSLEDIGTPEAMELLR